MGTTNQDVEYWNVEEDVEEEESSLKHRVPKTVGVAEEEAPPVPASTEIHDDRQLLLLSPGGEGALSQKLQSERSIYFDTNDGTEANSGTGGVKFSVISHSVSERKLGNGESDFRTNGVSILESVTSEHTNGTNGINNGVNSISVGEKKLGNGESDFTPNGVGITKSVVTETNNQNHRNPEVEEQSGLHLSHSIKSSENGSATFRPDDKPKLELVQEGIQEVVEWDVERVLDEQETHDLFCPNCHSCITKRVILRKRKRNIQIPQTETKREKIEVGQPAPPTNNQAPNPNLNGLDGSTHPGDITGQDRVEKPEVFRCLSCFSFFIPSVASFRSLWTFGNKGGGASVQKYQEVSPRVTPLRQGEDEVHRVEEVGIGELKSQYPPDHQSNQVSFVTPLLNKSSIQPTNVAASECLGNGKDFVVSSTTSLKLGLVKTGVEETPHGAVIKNRGDDENNPFSSLPTTYPLPVDSQANGQANVSSEKLWNNDQGGQVSSTSVSVHHVETRIDTSRRIDGGYSVMQDQRMGNLSNSLENMEKNLPHVSNGIISNQQGAQLPGSFNTKYEEFRKDVQAMSEGLLPQDEQIRVTKDLEDLPMSTNSVALPGSFNTKYDEFHKNIQAMSEGLLPQGEQIRVTKDLEDLPMSTNSGKDVILLISTEVSQNIQSNADEPTPGILTSGGTAYGASRQVDEATISKKWDILKSIVYGGLVESITSLAVVSSAAGGDATTLNIVALGLANLLGGLFLIVHNLVDLKNEPYGGDTNPNTTRGQYQEVDRYEELLGKRRNFTLHAIVALLSYIIFGLMAPVTYGFSFRQSDNKEYKLIVLAAAGIVCIILLAVAKTYVRKPPKAYVKTVLRYLAIGVMSSGLSYVAGTLINRLLQNLGWFDPTVDPVAPPSAFLESMVAKSSWALY